MGIIKTDKVYLKSVGEHIKHYEDEQGIHWYDYQHICSLILLTSKERDNVFKNWLHDNEKAIFNVNSEQYRTRFISSDGLSRIINRNYERGNRILKDIINTEISQGFYTKTEFDMCLDELGRKIKNSGPREYVDIVQDIVDIQKLDDFKETRIKYDKSYDKDKEELIDQIREELYNPSLLIDDYDEMEITLCKRKDDVTETSTCIKTKDTDYPEWIRNINK